MGPIIDVYRKPSKITEITAYNMDQRVQKVLQEKVTHERKIESEVGVMLANPGQDIPEEETMVGRLAGTCRGRMWRSESILT